MQSSGQIIFNQPHQYKAKPVADGQVRDPAQAAAFETKKDAIKSEVASNQKIDDLTKKVGIVLHKISTVFPFEFFPTDIIIRPTKVDIINRQFFWSEEIHTTMIKDITDITINTSIFFAALVITDQGYHDKLISVRFLKKSHALKARRIIQGLIIAMSENIDPEKIDPDELVQKVEQLGRSRET